MPDTTTDLIARLCDDAGYLGHEYKATVGETLRDAADALTALSQRVAELEIMRSGEQQLKEIAEQRAKEWCAKVAALESQLAAREIADPVAWLTRGALTGNPMLTLEPISEIASEPLYAHPPAAAASEDTKRLDWLDKNMFHREMNEWDARVHNGETMWVTFAPKGIQGSARKIIDAAKDKA
ncbi:MAG: hypothetical protein ACTHJ9_11875 [Rhodanobacter sp.]